jgi:hypothetical protein
MHRATGRRVRESSLLMRRSKQRPFPFQAEFLLVAGTLASPVAIALTSCAGSEPGPLDHVEGVTAGAGGSTFENGGAGGTGGAGGAMATAVGGSSPTVEAGTAGNGQAGTSATNDASSDRLVNSGGLDGGGKIPMCLTNDVAGGVNRATANYIECDVEDQAIDFDVAANYAPPRKPGYDPSTTPVTFTGYGSAFSGYEVQLCHPYCYKGNLTLGVDVVAGAAETLRGEVLFDFPPSVAPIVNAVGRASLGWIYLDGPALPPGAMLTAQMVLKSKDKGILVAKDQKQVTLKTWAEFKYFPIEQGFTTADLINITSIGFRLTFTQAGAQEWHGVVYADHFQLRK